MADKLIQIPGPITITRGPAAGQTVSFFTFIETLMNDARWGASEAWLDICNALEAQLKRLVAEQGAEWQMRASDWDVFKDIVQRPGTPYNTSVVKYLTAFIRAVVEAKTVDLS